MSRDQEKGTGVVAPVPLIFPLRQTVMSAQILDHPALTVNSRPSGIDPKTRAIEAYIDASVEAVLQGGAGSSQDGLLFLSSWHEAMPAMVFLDPVLSPADKVVFAVLWIWGRQHGRSSMAFPSYEYLMERCGIQSRSTLSRCLAILRITRWVTLCRKVRDAQGRNRGNIYALHEEPLALGGTAHLDPDYMEFLTGAARDHHHGRVRRVARAMLDSIRTQLAGGEDVLEDSTLSQIDRRQEAIAYVSGRGKSAGSSGRYFGLMGDAVDSMARSSIRRTKEELSDPVQKSNSVPSHRVRKKSNSVRSSSYIYKQTTTTTTDSGKELVTGELSTAPAEPGLIYPDALSRNERALAAMKVAEAPEDLRQPLLDELDGQIRARRNSPNPIRNPLGFLCWLCNQALAGHVHLTSAGVQVQERREREAHLARHEEAKARKEVKKPVTERRPRGLSQQAKARIQEMREACKGG